MTHQRIPVPLIPAPRHPYGCRFEDIPDDLVTWDGWHLRDLVPFDAAPPQGWYSVGHWLALVSPASLCCLLDTLMQSLVEMEAEAVEACRREGMEAVVWPAPPAIARAGIATVRLIPDPILRDLYR